MANSTGRKIKNYVLNSLKLVFAFSIIVWLVTSRYPFLTDKISEATEYYSFVDMYGYRAASWLKNVYPYKSTIVVTEKPGIFSGLFLIKTQLWKLTLWLREQP